SLGAGYTSRAYRTGGAERPRVAFGSLRAVVALQPLGPSGTRIAFGSRRPGRASRSSWPGRPYRPHGAGATLPPHRTRAPRGTRFPFGSFETNGPYWPGGAWWPL